ncbi:DUF169 domain-containing protein [Lagierella massiliensis]|uniref:DUF169 domain-containing protein n=1 Tax=Lagierella massiliensis TaxID=1689303 RepID=UPI0006D7B198|nr:DUF169 domain-containing protein [Lagierella massiliensis]
MKDSNVNKIIKILDLQREIIGVKFLYYKEEYDQIDVEEYGLKTTYCNMLKRAMDGMMFKLTEKNFFCDYGAYATGIKKADISIARGSSYGACGLYESNAISRSITEEMCYLQHDAYGLLIGPLQKMGDADIAIIVTDAANVMRILQGYAYKYGMPKNIRTLGNQAACSDLTSKPYFKNDLNVSLMCEGARKYMKCSRGELGVGMPIHQFDAVVEGIIMTVNPVASAKEKDALLKRLDNDDELGIKIDKTLNYGKKLDEYDDFVKKINKNIGN